MTLWILFCRMNKSPDTLFPFYARDRAHAEEQAATILAEHPFYERLDLEMYPHGFTFFQAHIAGTMEEERQ